MFRLRELRFELLDLVFVGPAVELEERLAFLDRLVRLDQHRRDQRGSVRRGTNWMVCWTTLALFEAGVMKRSPIMKISSTCTMKNELTRSPRHAELEPLELEEDQPDEDQRNRTTFRARVP